jgi:hypothetical protein
MGVRLTGNVRLDTGDPATNITIYLIPRIPEWERPDLPRRANTDAQGNFVLRGVAPGEYDLFSESMLDPTRQSIAVTVTNDSPRPLNLMLGARRSLASLAGK